MRRRGASFWPSDKRRGQSGEDAAAATLLLRGYQVHAVARKGLRSFTDYSTRQPRLGWSHTDDGDILGLFDMLGWSLSGSVRIQVKDHHSLVSPPANWREAVRALTHAPGVRDCWWSREEESGDWYSWEYHPDDGGWTVEKIGLNGIALEAPRPWVPGMRVRSLQK